MRLGVEGLILVASDDAASIWERFGIYFCEDARREPKNNVPNLPFRSVDLRRDHGLYELARVLGQHERRLSDFSLPAANHHQWNRMGVADSLLGAMS